MKRKHPKLSVEERWWHKRYSLFSRFDLGCELDEESWYSVTPEALARHHARRVGGPGRVVLDACCGVGGNTIQLAKVCDRVIAVDIDEARLAMARTNAAIYGVADRIEFVCGDFLSLAAQGAFAHHAIDAVFVSPPWGGPQYIRVPEFHLRDMPIDAGLFWMAARCIAPHIGMFLPRNTVINELKQLCSDGALEIESNFLNHRCISITAYWTFPEVPTMNK